MTKSIFRYLLPLDHNIYTEGMRINVIRSREQKKINKVALSAVTMIREYSRRMIAFLDQRLQNEIGVFHFFVNFTPLSQNLHFSSTYLDPA